MGARGPKPLSARVLKARGSWRAKAREREELLAANSDHGEGVSETSEFIESPDWLPNGHDFWKSVGQRLIDDGKLDSELDMMAFSMLARSLSDYEAALKILDAEGYICTSEAGAKYQHPCVGIANKARDAYLKIAKEFGLVGPASRENIQ